MLSIIVAKSKNNVIGKDNKLIWHISDDLKRFKKLTIGHTIIMGRKTFESLGRVLPNRFHVIVTSDKNYLINYENNKIKKNESNNDYTNIKNSESISNCKNIKIVTDISELEEYINDKNENFVIGGESIYRELIDKCEKMYVTQINSDFEGDAYFPDIDLNKWKVIEKIHGPKDENDFEYDYITYCNYFMKEE